MAKAGAIKWNLKGFEDLRRSPAMARVLNEEVKAVLTAVQGGDFGDDDYAGGVEPGRTRLRGYVVTASGKAIRREAEDHALLRALGGG